MQSANKSPKHLNLHHSTLNNMLSPIEKEFLRLLSADLNAGLNVERKPVRGAKRHSLEAFQNNNFDPRYIERFTFKYIYRFKNKTLKEEDFNRFQIAMEDYGYTEDELENCTIPQIVTEILSRE